jgi:hypothetical protein
MRLRVISAAIGKWIVIDGETGMKRVFLLLAVISVGLCVASYALVRTLSKTSSQRVARSNRTFMAYPVRLPRYQDLSVLVDHSSEIVIGVPTNKTSLPSAAANHMMFTDYQIRVLDILRGNKYKGGTIAVRVAGGGTATENNASEVAVPAYWKNPEIGKAYVFFLRSKKGGPSKLVGGPQGLFEISGPANPASVNDLANQTVIPQVLESDDLTKNYSGKNVGVFLAEIKQIIGASSPLRR